MYMDPNLMLYPGEIVPLIISAMPIYSLCKNIRSNFGVHILSYIHDLAIKALSQICDISNQFLDILAQLTSNLFTRTVSSRPEPGCLFLHVPIILQSKFGFCPNHLGAKTGCLLGLKKCPPKTMTKEQLKSESVGRECAGGTIGGIYGVFHTS